MNSIILKSVLVLTVVIFSLSFFGVNASSNNEEGADEESLMILESQLNENSITGVLQNPYNHSVRVMMVQAEFYDKEDGHLIGLRNFGHATIKDELNPGEKTPFKIPEMNMQFPKSDFVVSARGSDITGEVDMSFEELTDKIKNLGNALNSLPSDVVVNVSSSNSTNNTN